MNDDKILSHLREARAEILDRTTQGAATSAHLDGASRALALVLTHIDTAILWRQEDIRLKAPTVNEADK